MTRLIDTIADEAGDAFLLAVALTPFVVPIAVVVWLIRRVARG